MGQPADFTLCRGLSKAMYYLLLSGAGGIDGIPL